VLFRAHTHTHTHTHIHAKIQHTQTRVNANTHTHTHTKMKLHENAVTQTGLRASPTQRVLAPSDPSSGPFTRLAWPCMTVLLFLSISPLSLALPCGDQLPLLATSV